MQTVTVGLVGHWYSRPLQEMLAGRVGSAIKRFLASDVVETDALEGYNGCQR